VRLTIDGSYLIGRFTVNCECGDSWHGCAEPIGESRYSPALPIGDAVVHVKLMHKGAQIEVCFTLLFERWLHDYWKFESLRQLEVRSIRR
jgi:hypothetical protein